jgi:N-acetylmuramoyl-L-alanine amidase
MDGDVPLLGQPLRRAQFVVLKAPDVPSALVECGFLSHPQEEAALRRADHRARVAASLAEAIMGFIGRRVAA